MSPCAEADCFNCGGLKNKAPILCERCSTIYVFVDGRMRARKDVPGLAALSVSPPPSEPPEAINLLRQLSRDMGSVRTVLARKSVYAPDDEAQDRMLRRWESQIAQIEALLAAPPEPEAAPPQPELPRYKGVGVVGYMVPANERGVYDPATDSCYSNECEWVKWPDVQKMLAALSSPLPSEPKPALEQSEEAHMRLELGLNVDILDVDLLRLWANRFADYGPNVTEWGSVEFVVGKLRDIATRLEQEVRDVGELRKRVIAAEER